MSQLDEILPPKIKNRSKSEIASNVPEGLWRKCPACSVAIYPTELQQNHQICPKCNHHNPLSARERLNLLLDEGDGEKIGANIEPADPLKFKDSKKYPSRLIAVHKATGEDDALVMMKGMMDGLPVVAATFGFRFIGGSMGPMVGERFVQSVRHAVADSCPFICVITPGGTRMQEGANSLMQMIKTSTTLHLLTEKGLPFIFVLTDPTMGGISASLAFLGDVALVEPNVLIGLASPRAIEQTVHEMLPEGFQRAELLLEKGATDQIVGRHSMKRHICGLITLPRHKGKIGMVWTE